MGSQKYYSRSAAETYAFGRKIGAELKSGQTFCLTGTLGSGKTVFTQGLAAGLGIKKRVLSPTFILRRDYSLAKNGLTSFHHLDFYRLGSVAETESLGLDQLYDQKDGVVVIEWGEKFSTALPSCYRQIIFKEKNGGREIVIESKNSS